MLYTVLGLYDPAELAIDTRLILFVPSHHGFARVAESSAPNRMPVVAWPIRKPARHGIRWERPCVLRIAGRASDAQPLVMRQSHVRICDW